MADIQDRKLGRKKAAEEQSEAKQKEKKVRRHDSHRQHPRWHIVGPQSPVLASVCALQVTFADAKRRSTESAPPAAAGGKAAAGAASPEALSKAVKALTIPQLKSVMGGLGAPALGARAKKAEYVTAVETQLLAKAKGSVADALALLAKQQP